MKNVTFIGIILVGVASFEVGCRRQNWAPVPFTATYETRGRNGELNQLIRIARRSDGATFKSEVGPNGMYTVSIEMPDGTRVTLSPSLKEKTTWPRLQGKALQDWYSSKLPVSSCQPRGRGRLTGTSYFRTEPVEIRESISCRLDTRLTFEFAPRLACELIQSTWVRFSSGALVSQGRITKLDYGDPDPKLFEVPRDYKETRPSVAVAEQAKQRGVKLTEGDERENREADRRYDASPR